MFSVGHNAHFRIVNQCSVLLVAEGPFGRRASVERDVNFLGPVFVRLESHLGLLSNSTVI